MKIYDFTSRTSEYGRVVFALTLDRQRLKERIVIGNLDEVRHHLQHGDGDVYYDDTRPLGKLITHFESDKDGNWNKNHMILRESYGKERILPIPKKERWAMVAPVQEFLTAKYNNGEPSAIFAAIRTWDEYLITHSKTNISDTLTAKLHMMYKPFMVYDEYKPWQPEAVNALSVALQPGETQVELWHPIKKRLLETVVTSSSFLPVIFYYMKRIEEWGYVFQKCKVCTEHFLARSRHYELCSDECKKKQSTTRKREYDERTKEDKPTLIYDAAYYHWYNRLKKLRKGKLANLENAAVFEVELEKFRKEGIRQKTAVKEGTMNFVDFSSWLMRQKEFADELMDGFSPK